MKAIFRFVFIFFSICATTQAQIENEKVVFSKKGDLILLKDTDPPDYYKKCELERFFINSLGKDSLTNLLLKSKDSIYFEIYGSADKRINDSIFSINKKIQYKNRDTSYYPFYIYDKMSLKKFYKKYKFNQIGKLINNELEFKIDNFRDTIYEMSVKIDNYKNPKLKTKAKLFNLTILHNGKVLKKLNLPFSAHSISTSSTEEDIKKIILINENLNPDFTSFLEKLIIELDLFKTNQNFNSRKINLKVYNFDNKYYIEFLYYNNITSSFELTDEEFNVKETIEDEQVKSRISTRFLTRTTHYCKDNYINEFLILD